MMEICRPDDVVSAALLRNGTATQIDLRALCQQPSDGVLARRFHQPQ
jgi:hypothetical protein